MYRPARETVVTAPDDCGQLAPGKGLRQTIDDVEGAIGSLPDGYNERDAIRLIKALGNCDAFIARALDHLHTAQQEDARRAFHGVCTNVSTAIRHAVGYPGRSEHEQRVVGLASELKSSARRVRETFGW